MTDPAFDTLGAARKLKTAGIEAEQADAIVEVMRESANQFVTVEHFDAGLARLQAQIDGLSGRIDTLRIEMRADIVRSQLIVVTIVIAANALMMTVMGILLNQGAIL